MRKIRIILSLVIIYILLISWHTIYAYSNEYYSIYIPSSYTEIKDNYFMDDNGLNINIIIDSHSYKGEVYTNEHLNDFVDRFKSMSENDILSSLKSVDEKYNTNYTNEELEELSNSIKIETTSVKEISTFTKNNYKCFHYILKISFGDFYYYANQYCVFTKNNYFILTITGNDMDYFNNSEITKTINSFTIKNYQEVEKEESIWEKTYVSAISAMILAGISFIFNKKKSKKITKQNEQTNANEVNEINLSNSNEIVIEKKDYNLNNQNEQVHKEIDKKHCTNCGKEIENTWAFCNYCGNKLNGGNENEE